MKTLAPVLLSLCLSSLAHADASLEFVGAKPQAVYDLLLVQKFPKQIWKKGLKSALGYKVLTGKVRCIANKREALYFCHLEQLDPSTGKVAMIREISGDEHVMKFFDMVFEAKLARGMLVWGEPEALGGAILRTSMMECIFRDPSVYEENKMTPKFAYTGCTLTNRKGDL